MKIEIAIDTDNFPKTKEAMDKISDVVEAVLALNLIAFQEDDPAYVAMMRRIGEQMSLVDEKIVLLNRVAKDQNCAES